MKVLAGADGSGGYGLYIAGQWLPPRQGETFPTVNPYTRTAWATISQAGPDDAAAAVAAARRTFEATWRKTSGMERGRLLLRLADLLERDADRMALLESTDNGKVIRETKPQMLFAARIFRFYAGFTDKLWGRVIPLDQPNVFDYATCEPLGVVGLITAWNSPIALLANKLPAALAAGNCVVVKPSEHASVTTLEFSRLMEEAGFPPGVFNVITGDGRAGRALVETAGIDKISFTGSGRTGRLIAEAAGRRLVPVIMELGGKSPNIIFEDANLDRAVVGALAGIFAATGQTCIAGSRLLVQRAVYRTVVRRLAERAASIRLGNPLDPATEMGTAANEPQFRTILDYIATGKRQGARLEAGGGPATDTDLAGGLFVQPTIFSEVSSDMTLAQEEVFGPVLSVIPFDGEDDAVSIANGTQFGLASGI
ncbi:MAG: aldehyde dehydrogenase family protein, partial [Rhodospirillales bacterium]|nr:aldehyde dehydrogenase family protein [Rhodospirillales bacterium]